MRHRWWIGCLGALACALGLALGCQGGADTEEEDVGVRVAPITEKDLLEKLADASENEEIEVPGATPKDIEKALDDLDKRLLSRDIDGVGPWMARRIPRSHVQRASQRLGMTEEDILQRLRRLAPLGVSIVEDEPAKT